MSPYAYLPCTGSYASPNDKAKSQHLFHNWDPYVNQQMDMPTALAYSCDTYFYQLGDLFYGLPKSPPAAAPEVGGGVRVRADHARRRRPRGERSRSDDRLAAAHVHAETDPGHWQVDSLWKPGDSIQLAIGQKDLLVTPLQMARFYALIANGGKLVTPHVLMDVENANGTAVPVAALPAPHPVGARPRGAAGRPPGPLGGDPSQLRHLVRRVRELPRLDRRQDRNGREGRHTARIHRPPEPVVVVRLRADRQRRRSSSAP